MNAIKVRNLLDNIRGNLLRALDEQNELEAYVAENEALAIKAAGLMPNAKRAAIVALAAIYEEAANKITQRIDNVDTNF